MTGPLVGVVTPAYNDERHLSECVESVLAQTYSNWEHVILDNCSSDRTLEVARRYAAADPRIRVHSNAQLAPAIRNHNLALRLASPSCKYLKVVFSDDWIFPECIERMVALAEANPTVGLVGAYGLRGEKVAWDGLAHDETVVNGREICRRRLLGGDYVFGSPTSLLMRADLVRRKETFYNEANLHADTEACFDVLRECDFGFVHQVLTFTREEPDSLTSFSARMNTYLPAALYDLVTYGPGLLTAVELDAELDALLRRYYRFLARGVFRGPEFWRYHTEQLRRAGLLLSHSRVGFHVAGALLDALLNPRLTVSSLLAKRRARNTASEPAQSARPSRVSRADVER
jgi:glycosyltransferase involved in cell wall biosynthesis